MSLKSLDQELCGLHSQLTQNFVTLYNNTTEMYYMNRYFFKWDNKVYRNF